MSTKKAFTMIEMMIAITIIVILTMLSYAPYNYYQNKAKLKIVSREVTQLLYESRNMAVNGAVGVSSNISVGVYFDTSPATKNSIKIFSYPYDINTIDIDNKEIGDIKIIKVFNLEKGIQIDSIGGKDNFLFFFDAITGEVTYYTWNGLIKSPISNNKIKIDFSYEGSNSVNLQKTINYFTSTNIIDY